MTEPLSPEREQQIRCVSSHWSLPVACTLPVTHRENWHQGRHAETGDVIRYRRTVGATEVMRFGEWQPMDVAGPRSELTREELLAEINRVRAEMNSLCSGVLHLAAEAHRRKWAHDPGEDRYGNPIPAPAFDELHRIGNELRALWDKSRKVERRPAPVAVPAAGETGR